MKRKRGFVLFLLLWLLTITLNFIPDLVSDVLKVWCLEWFGPKYPWYLIGFFIVVYFILQCFGDLKDLLGTKKQSVNAEKLNIPWSLEAKQRLQNARNATANAEQQTALQLL